VSNTLEETPKMKAVLIAAAALSLLAPAAALAQPDRGPMHHSVHHRVWAHHHHVIVRHHHIMPHHDHH
jgi:Spy/CpxP family protein refolding chaperone